MTDSERLQWFADQDGKFMIRKRKDDNGYVIWDHSMGLCLAGHGVTISDAIDHAMTYKDGVWNE